MKSLSENKNKTGFVCAQVCEKTDIEKNTPPMVELRYLPWEEFLCQEITDISYNTKKMMKLKEEGMTVREKEKVTAELQLHSDQGFQYTSNGYFKLTQSYGITPSMS